MKIEIISPVFNEEQGIEAFVSELNKAIDLMISKRSEMDFSILLVDDGSTDNSIQNILAAPSSVPIKVLQLSRNFGHQNALWAGLECADSRSHVIVLDSDLQDPPKEIEKIVDSFYMGSEVVLMRRASRKDTRTKKVLAKIFYLLQKRLTKGALLSNVGDFFGLNPSARHALLSHGENIKYIRGLIAQLGFKRAVIDYHRMARNEGITHYTPRKMASLAAASLTGFSTAPLMWSVGFSILGFLLGFSIILYIMYLKFLTSISLPIGWAFSTIVILAMSIFQMIILSIISLYLARIIQEQKNRPLYIVSKIWSHG
jgi:glycosyltransferase involved in cell wall biosynthesis